MELASNLAKEFTQRAKAIVAEWETSIHKYRELRQQTTTTIPELEPSFETRELLGTGSPKDSFEAKSPRFGSSFVIKL